MWYYTERNGLAHYWALDDEKFADATPSEFRKSLLVELDSKVRDLYEMLKDNNTTLENLYQQVQLLIGDKLSPIEMEQLRVLFLEEGGQ